MKLLHQLFLNSIILLKRKFRVFLLLIASLIILSMATILLYSQVSVSYNSVNSLMGKDRIIDFIVNDCKDSTTIENAIESANSECEDVLFACVLLSINDEYSLLGTSAQEHSFLAVSSGEWLSGQGQIFIPEGSFDGAGVGDTVTVNSCEFTVCGTYPADIYDNTIFLNEKFCYKNVPGVFINYKDCEKISERPYSLRIRCIGAMSKEERSDIAKLIIGSVADKGIGLTYEEENIETVTTIDSQFYGKFVLYSIMLVVNIAFIVLLYNFVIKIIMDYYKVIIRCGSTPLYAAIISTINMGVYLFPAYLLGYILASFIIRHDLQTSSGMSYLSFPKVLLLFLIIFSIVLLSLFLCSIKRLCNNKGRGRISADHISKRKVTKLRSANYELLKKFFSRDLWVECSVFLQMVFVCYLFVSAMGYFIESKANTIYVNRTYDSSDRIIAVDCSKYDNAKDLLADYDEIESVSEIVITRIWRRIYGSKEKIGDAISLQQVSGEISANENLCKSGSWFSQWSDGVELTECEYVPVVLTAPMAEHLNAKINDTLEGYGLFNDVELGEIIVLDDGTLDSTTIVKNQFCLKVVGIIGYGERAIVLDGKPMSMQTLFQVVDKDIILAYSPKLYVNGVPVGTGDDIGSKMPSGFERPIKLITAEDESDVDNLKQELQAIGECAIFKDISKKADDESIYSAKMYRIQLIAAISILIIGCVVYTLLLYFEKQYQNSIYYMHGMTTSKLIKLTLCFNSIIFALSAIVGTILGVVITYRLSMLSTESIIISFVLSIILSVLLIVISTVVPLCVYSRLSPITRKKR